MKNNNKKKNVEVFFFVVQFYLASVRITWRSTVVLKTQMFKISVRAAVQCVCVCVCVMKALSNAAKIKRLFFSADSSDGSVKTYCVIFTLTNKQQGFRKGRQTKKEKKKHQKKIKN